MLHVEYTTEEKAAKIWDAVKSACSQSEFGAGDLAVIRRQCNRIGIDEDDMQQFLAVQKAAGAIYAEVIGRSYYIIIK